MPDNRKSAKSRHEDYENLRKDKDYESFNGSVVINTGNVVTNTGRVVTNTWRAKLAEYKMGRIVDVDQHELIRTCLGKLPKIS